MRGSVWVYDEEYWFSVDRRGTRFFLTTQAIQRGGVLFRVDAMGETLKEARSALAHNLRQRLDVTGLSHNPFAKGDES